MSDIPTMKDEYEMLVGELRQNRQIQLQTFFSTPIWLSLFFGLMSSGLRGIVERMSFILLIPIPLIFLNLLLIIDRRRSSDIIIAYFRTAFDQRLTDKPGWNSRLPRFRKILKDIKASTDKSLRIPQRFDINVIVWITYFALALICLGFYWLLFPRYPMVFGILIIITTLLFIAILFWITHLANIKPKLIKAWEETLLSETSVGRKMGN